MNKKTICHLSKLNGINIPRDIIFEESDDRNTLILTMKYIGITDNMQEYRAAFEAWALLGKAKKYDKVVLNIENNLVVESKKVLHYNRFLYRVYNFNKLFDWFEMSNDLACRVNDFYNKYFNGSRLVYNVPTPEDEKYLNKPTVTVTEHYMEDFFISHKDITNNILGINTKEYFSQLPVGLFYNEKRDDDEHRIFTGRKSAIDFWTVVDDTLNIIELKIGNNKKIGVLSELFFYTCLMRDLHINKIAEPSEQTDIRGFNKIQNIKKIKSFILLEKQHKWLKDAYEELKKASEKDAKISFADDVKEYNHRNYNIKNNIILNIIKK